MDFFDSISYPFTVWQLLWISPFAVDQIPSVIPEKMWKHYFQTGILTICLLSTTLAVFGTLEYVAFIRDPWVCVALSLSSLLIHSAAVVVVIESWVKRERQKQLLQQLNHIDSVLKQNIDITIKYAAERRQYKWRFKCRCIVLCWIVTIFFLCGLMKGDIFAHIIYRALNSCLYIVIVMWFHQYSTYVDMIFKRFRWINEEINKIYLNNLNRVAMRDNVTKVMRFLLPENSEKLGKKLATNQ